MARCVTPSERATPAAIRRVRGEIAEHLADYRRARAIHLATIREHGSQSRQAGPTFDDAMYSRDWWHYRTRDLEVALEIRAEMESGKRDQLGRTIES